MAKNTHEEEYRLVDKVSAGFGKIAEGLKGLSTSFTEVNQAAELASKAIGGIASVGAFFGDMVVDAGAYEQKLAQVESRTRATAEESILLRSAIQSALQDTAFSASAAAEALRLMADDGANATEAAQNLGDVAAYAQANTRGLSETVGGLGAVLDTFDLGAEKIGSLADAITETARAAGTSTKAIEDGLAGVGVAATQAGLSLEEAVAMIGTLAERGVEGGRAAGVLTKVLQELSDPASQAGEALQKAGVDGSDLSGVLQRLAIDGALSEKVLAGLGDRPKAALRLLLADGGKSLQGLTEAINQSAGASKRASDELGKGFELALARLQNSFDNAKNTFLEPLLAPLANSFDDFATRINTLSQSGDFKAIADQIAKLVAAGLVEFEKFLAGFNFETAVASVRKFADDTAVILVEVRDAFGTALTAGANFSDGIAAAFNASVTAVAGSLASTLGAFATFSDAAGEVSLSLAAIAEEAKRDTGDALGRIAMRMDETAAASAKAARALDDASKSTQATKESFVALYGPVNAFGLTLEQMLDDVATLPATFDMAAAATDRLAAAQEDLKGAMAAVSTAALEVELNKLVLAQTALIQSGQQNSAEFYELSRQIAATEGSVAKLKEAQSELAKANKDSGDSARDAAGGLREYASAADSAGTAASHASESNSAVSESFGNITGQSSSVAVSLGNMSEAFTRMALAAAGASRTAEDYVDTWNRFVAQAEDEDRRIADRIDQLQRQNAVLDEESRIRRVLEQQYGTSSTRLEELVQLELKLAEAKRTTNRESERSIEIEQRRAGLAGGIGTQNQGAGTAAPATSAGRGSAGGGGRDAAQVVSVTINGLPTDRASVRSWVSDVLLPELDRVSRLSR